MASHRFERTRRAAGLAVLVLAASAARAADDVKPPAAAGAPPAAPTLPVSPTAPAVPVVPAAPPSTAAPSPAVWTAPKPPVWNPQSWVVPAAPEPAAGERSALRDAVEKALGAPVHGRLSVQFEARFYDPGHEYEDTPNDFDLITRLDVRVGDETKDRLSAAAYVRLNADIGSQHEDGGQDNVYLGLSDTYDSSVNAQLFTAYVTWRPKDGPVEAARFGRQYVYTADTFQFDGASAISRPLVKEINLQVQAYGGVPVHFYQGSTGGDFVAGVRATADPRKGTRAALDYAHVQDESAGYSTERNDLAAASLWQSVGENAEIHGQYTWLEGPRDVFARGTVNFPAQDLLLQVSYRRMLQDETSLATEFDPYYELMRTLYRYHQAEFRAVKGFGEILSVEGGASVRRLIDDGDEGIYNRDTTRYWLSPSFDDLIIEGSTLTLTGERWAGGDDEATNTGTLDFTYRVSRDTRLSVGTDFARWDYGPINDGERSNLRTAYVRMQTKLGDGWAVDVRYAWESDDEETDNVFILGLSVDF